MHPIDFALKYNLQDVVELIKPYMMMPSLKKISGKQVLYNILQQEDVEMQKKYLSILPTEMLEYLKREINKEITTLHYKPYNYNYSQQLKNLKSLIDQIAY